MIGMRRAWELLALIIIGGLLVQMVVEWLEPLIPYMVAFAMLVMIGGFFLHRYRSW